MITGYITEQQLFLFRLKEGADKAQEDTKWLVDLIKQDQGSEYKKAMRKGNDYYAAKHDILKRTRYYYVEGKTEVALGSANNRIPHPFLRVLVNQKAAYIAGHAPVLSIAVAEAVDPTKPTEAELAAQKQADEYNRELSLLLGDGFDDDVNELIKHSSNKGQEWIHVFIDSEGAFNYVITPAEQIIAVYDTQYQKTLTMVIRYYGIDFYDPSTEKVSELQKVEVWDANQVTYYAEVLDISTGQKKLVKDSDYPVNPMGHYKVENSIQGDVQKGWGRVPFLRLPNNSELESDLSVIKELIDAYDSVKSGWINDIDDFQEVIMVVKGYAGLRSQAQKGLSELAVFMQNVKVHKVVAVDSGGSVDTIKAEIPIEAKMKFLDITRKEIFYFGEGVDVDADKFGNSPSGVSLTFVYSLLDLKANRTIRKLKIALGELVAFATDYLMLTNSDAKYDSSTASFTLTKAIIFNEKEKIDGVMASEGLLSEQTLLENHPLAKPYKEEKARKDKEAQEQIEAGIVAIQGSDTDADTDIDSDGTE